MAAVSPPPAILPQCLTSSQMATLLNNNPTLRLPSYSNPLKRGWNPAVATAATNRHIVSEPSMLSIANIHHYDYSGFVNLGILVFIAVTLRLVIENLMKYGLLFKFSMFVIHPTDIFDRDTLLHSILPFIAVSVYITTIAPVFAYCIESLASRRSLFTPSAWTPSQCELQQPIIPPTLPSSDGSRVHRKHLYDNTNARRIEKNACIRASTALYLHLLNGIVLFISPLIFIYNTTHLGILARFPIAFMTVVTSMKLLSFAHTSVNLRTTTAQMIVFDQSYDNLACPDSPVGAAVAGTAATAATGTAAPATAGTEHTTSAASFSNETAHIQQQHDASAASLDTATAAAATAAAAHTQSDTMSVHSLATTAATGITNMTQRFPTGGHAVHVDQIPIETALVLPYQQQDTLQKLQHDVYGNMCLSYLTNLRLLMHTIVARWQTNTPKVNLGSHSPSDSRLHRHNDPYSPQFSLWSTLTLPFSVLQTMLFGKEHSNRIFSLVSRGFGTVLTTQRFAYKIFYVINDTPAIPTTSTNNTTCTESTTTTTTMLNEQSASLLRSASNDDTHRNPLSVHVSTDPTLTSHPVWSPTNCSTVAPDVNNPDGVLPASFLANQIAFMPDASEFDLDATNLFDHDEMMQELQDQSVAGGSTAATAVHASSEPAITTTLHIENHFALNTTNILGVAAPRVNLGQRVDASVYDQVDDVLSRYENIGTPAAAKTTSTTTTKASSKLQNIHENNNTSRNKSTSRDNKHKSKKTTTKQTAANATSLVEAPHNTIKPITVTYATKRFVPHFTQIYLHNLPNYPQRLPNYCILDYAPSLTHLFYFLIAPTLIYQVAYPRSARIKFHFLFRRMVEMLFVGMILLFLIEQYVRPTLKNSLRYFMSIDVATDQFKRNINDELQHRVLNKVPGIVNTTISYFEAAANRLDAPDVGQFLQQTNQYASSLLNSSSAAAAATAATTTAAPAASSSLSSFFSPLLSIVLGSVGVVERTLKLSLPNVLVWLFIFYGVFHSYLNFVAEIAQFGDRVFYLEWWNARDLGEYWNTWNQPVYQFFARHLFSTFIAYKVPTDVAKVGVFFVSAVLHEVLLAIPCQMLVFHAFFGMLFQVPLILITGYLHKKHNNPVIGNVIFWLSFVILGQPTLILTYFYQYLSTHNLLQFFAPVPQ